MKKRKLNLLIQTIIQSYRTLNITNSLIEALGVIQGFFYA